MNTTWLSKLTKEGVEKFYNFIDNVNEIDAPSLRVEILNNSEVVKPHVGCTDPANFPKSKIEVAEYLFNLLKDVKSSTQNDKALWCWISLYYFDVVCAKDKHGAYKPGDINRWVPAFDHHHKFHRHLLASPWLVYKRYPGDKEALYGVLSGNVNVHGDFIEQFVSRQELISCKPIMQAITRLYFDKETGMAKKGASSHARRFAAVHQQFSRTYDFYEMNPVDILNILPKEFDKFLEE